MITDDKPFRELDASEREIFNRLLEPEFEGRDALREQLGDFFVRMIDENGILKISVHSELEVYKDDSFRLASSVAPSRLELFCPPLVR